MSDDNADGVLLDVSELSLSELLHELDESGLAQALRQIFISDEEAVERHGFSSSI